MLLSNVKKALLDNLVGIAVWRLDDKCSSLQNNILTDFLRLSLFSSGHRT